MLRNGARVIEELRLVQRRRCATASAETSARDGANAAWYSNRVYGVQGSDKRLAKERLRLPAVPSRSRRADVNVRQI